MADIFGGVGLLLAALLPLIAARKCRPLILVLCVAWVVRASAALFHYYVRPLPDSTVDAVAFERHAWEWGQHGISTALSHYPGLDSYFYSWLMSLVYAVTGRSELLLQSLSVMVGVFGVYAAWYLAREIWNGAAARKAAWMMALFPTVVMYGAMPMREAYAVLFLLLGLTAVANWARWGGVVPVLAGIAAFSMGSFFHGGIFVASLLFLGLIASRAVQIEGAALLRAHFRLISALVLLAVVTLLAGYVFSDLSIHKVGTAAHLFSADRWLYFFETRTYGVAAYPGWTMPESSLDLVWAVPLRALYLLFAPFPWDVNTPTHFLGLLDGLVYLGLAVLIWRHRRAIWVNPGARSVLLVVIGLVFAFGVGSGNFGTGLRHRAKLAGALIALAAARLPRLVLRKANDVP